MSVHDGKTQPPVEGRAPDHADDATHSASGGNFLHQLIADDVERGKYQGRVVTRFPPEPNGYLHIGHAKAICVNFGLAESFPGARCHLRLDDTNPSTEDMAFVKGIQEDIKWLGFDWGEHLYFASDYFEKLYEFACTLIDRGLAYVDGSSEDEIREMRGTLATPGTPSKDRERSPADNRALFERMRKGEFEDGAMVLRAKIDLAAANMKMRDPLLYRIRHAHHYRTGDSWCIYPMYDFAHCLSDAIEGVTHSLCTLEFENNRAIYDWVLSHLDFERPPEQTEFARLNLTGVVTSKRKVLALVEAGRVTGWDDARLATLAGMRRRGVPAEAIRRFCERVGVAKTNSVVEMELLDFYVRDELNRRAPRVMCVQKPVSLILDNIAADHVQWIDAPHWPHDVEGDATRPLPFARELVIDADDFQTEPEPGFRRLSPGAVVRLRHAEVIRCDSVEHDADTGAVRAIHATVLESLPEGRYRVRGTDGPGEKLKPSATIHWLSRMHAKPVELRLYGPLFLEDKELSPEQIEAAADDPLARLNPAALTVVGTALIEPSVAGETETKWYQFERVGYFHSDRVDASSERLVFNRTVSLKDSWANKRRAEPTASRVEKPSVRPTKSAAPAKKRPEKRSRAQLRERLLAEHPELAEHQRRYTTELGLTADVAEVLTSDVAYPEFFSAARTVPGASDVGLARWFANELMGALAGSTLADTKITASGFGELVARVESGALTGPMAKEVLSVLLEEGGQVDAIVESRGLKPVTDDAEIAKLVDQILDAHPDELKRYRGGQKGLMGFFIGAVMKATKGKADPKIVRRVVGQQLESE